MPWLTLPSCHCLHLSCLGSIHACRWTWRWFVRWRRFSWTGTSGGRLDLPWVRAPATLTMISLAFSVSGATLNESCVCRCSNTCFAFRDVCNRCQTPKPCVYLMLACCCCLHEVAVALCYAALLFVAWLPLLCLRLSFACSRIPCLCAATLCLASWWRNSCSCAVHCAGVV